jgi:hypothetical protein
MWRAIAWLAAGLAVGAAGTWTIGRIRARRRMRKLAELAVLAGQPVPISRSSGQPVDISPPGPPAESHLSPE